MTSNRGFYRGFGNGNRGNSPYRTAPRPQAAYQADEEEPEPVEDLGTDGYYADDNWAWPTSEEQYEEQPEYDETVNLADNAEIPLPVDAHLVSTPVSTIRVCQHCHQRFPSNNKLHRHL